MCQPTESASLDAMLNALSASDRRRVLRAMSDRTLRHEDEFTADGTNATGRERTRTKLYHVHLPKLADNDYVEWNPDEETIRQGPRFDEIAPLLESLDGHMEGGQLAERNGSRVHDEKQRDCARVHDRTDGRPVSFPRGEPDREVGRSGLYSWSNATGGRNGLIDYGYRGND